MVGTITLSLEVELGWGMHDKRRYDHLSTERQAETEALHRLLECCDSHGVPVSFDVVGHLLLDECSGSHEGPYPDDWWSQDPGTDSDCDPLFYASDLIDRIRDATIDHEICTHTFSHTLYDEMSAAVLDAELDHVRSVHEAAGFSVPGSIVFPRHQTNHWDILRKHGIETVRHPIDGYGIETSNPLRTVHWILMRKHPVTRIRSESGLLVTPCTPHPSLTSVALPAGQSAPHPAFRAIPTRLRQRWHRQYLRSIVDRVAESGGHAHLWSHLYNLSNEQQLPVVADALSYIGEAQQAGRITVEPMCSLPRQ